MKITIEYLQALVNHVSIIIAFTEGRSDLLPLTSCPKPDDFQAK